MQEVWCSHMKSVDELLAFIYGADAAPAVAKRVRELIARHRPRLGERAGFRADLTLTERDNLLIVYGDHVSEPGRKPLRTLGEFVAESAGDVITGIHILPFYPYSSDDGFSVIDYLEVDPVFGDWGDVSAMGDRFVLMFDAVFNHVSSKSAWFSGFLADAPEYRDYFVSVEGDPDLSGVIRPRTHPVLTEFRTKAGATRKVWTTFSADQVDLNAANPEVAIRLLDVLLSYVARGAGLVRLDAIGFLWKEIGTLCLHLPRTHAMIQLMRAVLDEAAPDVLLITETNVPHVDNVSYFGDGRNEAQLVYNFALPPLMLHAILKGDASTLSAWARSLVFPSKGAAFFNFLASHDGIGMSPAQGILEESDIVCLMETAKRRGGYVSMKSNTDGTQGPYELNICYFDALSDPNDAAEGEDLKVARFLAAHGAMLALAGLPGIYFHSLYGSRNDRAGAEESGIPRRINREKLSRGDLTAALADPSSLRSKVLAGLKRLLKARGGCPAFHPIGAQEVLEADRRVFAIFRESPDGTRRALAAHNLSGDDVRQIVPIEGAAGTSLFDPSTRYRREGNGLRVDLKPYEVAWIDIE